MNQLKNIGETMYLLGRIWVKFPKLNFGELLLDHIYTIKAVGDESPFEINNQRFLNILKEHVKEVYNE